MAFYKFSQAVHFNELKKGFGLGIHDVSADVEKHPFFAKLKEAKLIVEHKGGAPVVAKPNVNFEMAQAMMAKAIKPKAPVEAQAPAEASAESEAPQDEAPAEAPSKSQSKKNHRG